MIILLILLLKKKTDTKNSTKQDMVYHFLKTKTNDHAYVIFIFKK